MWNYLPESVLQQIADVELVSSRHMLGVCRSWTQAFRTAKPYTLVCSSIESDDDGVDDYDYDKDFQRTMRHIKNCPDTTRLESAEINLISDGKGLYSIALAGALLVKFPALSTLCLQYFFVNDSDWLKFLPVTIKKLSFEWVIEKNTNLTRFQRFSLLEDLRLSIVCTDDHPDTIIRVSGELPRLSHLAICVIGVANFFEEEAAKLSFPDLSAEEYQLSVIDLDAISFPRIGHDQISFIDPDEGTDFFSFR